MSMKIHLEFDETDLYNTLNSIIDHPNKEEIVKLFTPFIGGSSDCSKWLFKLILGKKLPDILPHGTICLTHVNNLSYDIDKTATIASELTDNNGMIACTIKEFKGFHNWTHYEIEHYAYDKQGDKKLFNSYLMTEQLEIMEEF